jgi:hypothetical protein
MSRTDSDGNVIISAGEVATFVVCPEAWKLEIENVSARRNTSRSRRGRRLHATWSYNVDEAHSLLVGVRVLLYLLVTAVLALIFILNRG